jgi:hypothetical protein
MTIRPDDSCGLRLSDSGDAAAEVCADPVPDPYSAALLGQRNAELQVCLEVADSERRHARAALSVFPHPLLVTDPFDDLILMSAAAHDIFGIPAEAVGPLDAFFPTGELIETIRGMRGLDTRGAVRRSQMDLSTVVGMRTFDATFLCVCDTTDGRPSPWGVVTMLQDVSAQAAGVARSLLASLNELEGRLSSLLAKPAENDKAVRQAMLDIAAECRRLTQVARSSASREVPR